MRGKKANDPDDRLPGYREYLIGLGYSYTTASVYSRGAGRYMETGLPLETEAAEKYFSNLSQQAITRAAINSYRAGTMNFIKYIHGESVVRRTTNPKKKEGRMFRGCDEDCQNCKYDDCYLPTYKCKSIPYETWTGYATRFAEPIEDEYTDPY